MAAANATAVSEAMMNLMLAVCRKADWQHRGRGFGRWRGNDFNS